MSPHSGELWEHPSMPTYIDIDFLLPNGILVVQRCKREATLQEVKNDLWIEARNHPLFELLGSPGTYIFKSVTLDAEVEEFYDETRRICDLKMFHPMLKLVEPEGNREEKIVNSDLGKAMGMSINEFNEIKDLEVMTFRRRILTTCEDAVKQRNDPDDLLTLARYKYPPNVVPSHLGMDDYLPEHVQQAVKRCGDIVLLCVWVVPTETTPRPHRQKFTIKMQTAACPEDIVKEVIRKRLVLEGLPNTEMMMKCDQYKGTYVLKVCGLDEYLLQQCSILHYQYIRRCLLEGITPHLHLVHKHNEFLPNIVDPPFIMPSYHRKGLSAIDDKTKQEFIDLWCVRGTFSLKVLWATYITVTEPGKLFIRAGLYHGLEPICATQDTMFQDSSKPHWNETLNFPISFYDLPRSAKLCVGLCFVPSSRKRSRGNKITTSLLLGTVTLFDFTREMQSDRKKIFLSQPVSDAEVLNPLIVSAQTSSEPGVPCLEIEFLNHGYPVRFPDNMAINQYSFNPPNLPSKLPPDDLTRRQIEEISMRDGMADIADQEKSLLWEHRDYCCQNIPKSLPKLIAVTDWGIRNKVAEIYRLLNQWPLVDPEVALELLDCSCADTRVREFAVVCLEQKLEDTTLSLFLLQLVQAIRFEPYYDNPLTRFLLKRALLNQTIGHFFFWHLKSEMHTEERLRFGLIIEAYLRGCGGYLKPIIQQVEALEKLTQLTNFLKQEKEEEQSRLLAQNLTKPDYQDALQHLPSPLDRSQVLGKLLCEKSKVMPSKKRPLKLTWTNDNPLSKHSQSLSFKLIFKNGDDLRQDMLTLQVIRVMDSIWQQDGIDLRMLPYPVLATGNKVGLISVVNPAETVMHIQRTNLTAAMQLNTNTLHRWLRDQNDPEKYDRVIDNFTKSCAGYSVATYILGIGDRHPDNIMVTNDGKLFHVDFGHFLNHKKKKFGVNREKVPFVLTDDMINTITCGTTKSSIEFKEFQELCGRAYMSLRHHSMLLCTLFSMMLNSGIPELQSKHNLDYLRKTLAVDSSDEEALSQFQIKFCEAYNGAWTTKVDWFFHWLVNKKS